MRKTNSKMFEVFEMANVTDGGNPLFKTIQKE